MDRLVRYKRYLVDDEAAIPRTTRKRWKKQHFTEDVGNGEAEASTASTAQHLTTGVGDRDAEAAAYTALNDRDAQSAADTASDDQDAEAWTASNDRMNQPAVPSSPPEEPVEGRLQDSPTSDQIPSKEQ
ncbi:hypothetical protein KUCAC02_015776, partial [Chaenocephalus aceratus]